MLGPLTGVLPVKPKRLATTRRERYYLIDSFGAQGKYLTGKRRTNIAYSIEAQRMPDVILAEDLDTDTQMRALDALRKRRQTPVTTFSGTDGALHRFDLALAVVRIDTTIARTSVDAIRKWLKQLSGATGLAILTDTTNNKAARSKIGRTGCASQSSHVLMLNASFKE